MHNGNTHKSYIHGKWKYFALIPINKINKVKINGKLRRRPKIYYNVAKRKSNESMYFSVLWMLHLVVIC